MATAKWIYFLALCTFVVTCLEAETPTDETGGGYPREKCKHKRSQLPRPANVYDDRLYAVREQMRMRATLQGPEIDGYILPSNDEHLNDEVAPHDQRLLYLTGFTGIKAVAVITQVSAALWVDNRFVQLAAAELSCAWQLYEKNDSLTIANWLGSQVQVDRRIGADPHLVPHHLWLKWEVELEGKLLKLTRINNNLIDLVWNSERPAPVTFPIQVHERVYAGKVWQDKVTDLRHRLHSLGFEAMIVTSLTEIAYILNIRGRDIPYTPVVKGYLIITYREIYLYIDNLQKKVNLALHLHLHTDCYSSMCVKLKEYTQIWSDIRTYAQVWKRVLVPAPCVQEQGASEAIYAALPPRIAKLHVSPIIYMRAQKNPEERSGMRAAHVKDAAAICEAMSNLEARFLLEQWTEQKIKYEVERSRLSQKNAEGLSLRTVVAYGEHAALPYYLSSNITDMNVGEDSTLIIESGGQYLEGTTDVSRTYIIGEPSPEMKRAYTNVLIGILRLSQLKFPADLKLSSVDTLVRSPIWGKMVDYPQATGHGIGVYSAVEEPPISVSYGEDNNHHFKDGYFFSSESRYFKPREFGIRLKNVLEVNKLENNTNFLTFEDVTLVPYEPKLIDGTLLSSAERPLLNEYNARIRKLVGYELKLQGNMQAFYWMMNKTRHIREYLTEAEYEAAIGASQSCSIVPNIRLLFITFALFVSICCQFF